VADPLPVHVNRGELHDLDVPASYEAAGTFDVRLVNHGAPGHVHLHLDDQLSELARLEATNHYVDGETERFVRVAVRDGATGAGKLKVVSGHGAKTRYVDVDIVKPEEEASSVRVDDSLNQPQPTEPEPAETALGEESTLAVLGLAAIALTIAIGAALALQQTVVVIGALAVLVGVSIAAYVLLVE
jgi:hypothetical protein